jgi:hypothetical protein
LEAGWVLRAGLDAVEKRKILSHICVTIDGVWIGEWIYCPLIHDSELQAITAPPLISTIHKPPQHLLSLFKPALLSLAVPWLRLLTLQILQLDALRFYLHSLPCRTATELTLSLVYKISALTT